jgi:hypothetical protein
MSRMQACTQISDEQTGGKIIPHCNRLLTGRFHHAGGVGGAGIGTFLRTSLARL